MRPDLERPLRGDHCPTFPTARAARPQPEATALACLPVTARGLTVLLLILLVAGCATEPAPAPSVNPAPPAAAGPAANRPGQAGRGALASRPRAMTPGDINPRDAIEAVRRGRAREALDRYSREATDLERRGQRFEAASALVAVQIVAHRLGRYQEGIRAGLRALELLEPEPQTERVIQRRLTAYSNLGKSYADIGDAERARRYWEDGLAQSRRLSVENRRLLFTGVFSQHLAQLARASGDHALALRYGMEAVSALDRYVDGLPAAPRFDQLRSNGRRLLTSSLFQTGEAQLGLGKLGEAESSFERATRVVRLVGADPAGVAALIGIGRVALARQDYARAESAFRDAQVLAQRLNSISQLMFVHLNVAQAHAAQGRHAEALVAYRRALDLVEDVRAELQQSEFRASFLENKQAMYHGAVRSALALGQVGDAFAYAERARARAFLDLLGNQSLSKGKTRDLLEEEARLRAQLAEARALAASAQDPEGVEDGEGDATERPQERVEAAERAYSAFLARVRMESHEQASLMTVEPVSLQEVQRLLPGGTTLLEYLVTGAETFVWVIDRDRVDVVRLPVARADLVGRVRAFRRAIAEHAASPRVEALGQALEAQLLQPARAYIRGDRLLVVPHDVLHYLPFAALRSPDGRWLVEDYALGTLPSASVLKFLGDKGAGTNTRVLAMGNPDLGSATSLRYAEREARVLAAQYPGATVLVREAATEATAKRISGEAGLIHFATHGELNETDPLGSALLLTPDATEDGRLEVREVLALELRARLVVLSACETGLGKLSRGDELVGLQRAFLYAGTPAVVTTLWKVDDRASYELMREFYARLEAEGPAAALRAAQRAVMREFPQPFAWAPFGLTGVPW